MASVDAGNESGPTNVHGKNAAIVLCCLLGNGSLFPWNSMVNIEDYYLHLFPHYHPSRVLTLVYQCFALSTISILAYKEAKINTRLRNLSGYMIFTISTLLVLILDLATSGKGGIHTFIGICVINATLGVADALTRGGMVGDLSFMPPEFVQSFLAGNGASGALTSGLRLITKAAFKNSKDGLRKGAILFFAISASFEVLCVVLYAFVFPKLPIVKYYRLKAAEEGSKTVYADLAAGGVEVLPEQDAQGITQQGLLGKKQVLFKSIDFALGIFLIYLLSLSIFPGFLSEDTGKHSLGTWYSLVLLATYNICDVFGRFLPLIKFLELESRKGLLIAIMARFSFIPAFYFTAKYGDQGWMIMLSSILGLSNGYLIVCVMTAAPKGYKGPEQNALGNMLVFFLLGGVFAGVTLDWLWLIAERMEELSFNLKKLKTNNMNDN